MSNKFAYLLSLVLIITILFFPARFSKEPLKDNPKTNLRKRITRLITEKPEFKAPEKSFNVPFSQIKEEDSQDRVMASALREEINRSINKGIKNIRIVLNTTGDTDALENMVENYGGKILRERPGFMAVEVPVDKAEQLIEENNSIGYARLPFKFFPTGKVTEGVNLTGANILHDTIYRGAGVKIAVLDVGFKGLTDAISAGELPSDVKTHDFSGKGLETEYKHGTACAEIIHDMAPDAELYLIKMGDEIAGYDAIDYCMENNINIVSLSIGTFGSGPGDGTGPVDEAFDQLRDAGILVVASAGNYGNTSNDNYGTHWEGEFIDGNFDSYNDFSTPYTSGYNVIGATPSRDDDGNPSTSEVSIMLRWDDWPVSNIDYDMYLYEYDYTDQKVGNLVASSTTIQDGTQPPVEYISMDIPDSETGRRFFALKIKKRTAETPSGTKLEIYLGGTSKFFIFGYNVFSSYLMATSTSSIAEPADAESVMAVGAVDYKKWATGPQEEYSSRGPTNNWNGSSEREKPDIMGPDGVTTYTYGDSSFRGTSAAASHVAGMAALTLSMNPDLTPDELQRLLEDNTVDVITYEKDPEYVSREYDLRMLRAVSPFYPVKLCQKINKTEGNFTGVINDYCQFGHSVTPIGDLNGDGIIDLAVGAPDDYDEGPSKGAVWILFMNADGTVKTHQKISDTEGNFKGTLNYGDRFGSSVAFIGDLNKDGTGDLAVGAEWADVYGKGALWILFMNADGTVKAHQKINETEGNFSGTLPTSGKFGSSVTYLHDLNGDGVGDLAVGASGDMGGALWILFMNSDGTVKSHRKITDAEVNPTYIPGDYDYFGCSVAYIGDLNKDGTGDLAVGATVEDAVWILFMNSDGTVKSYQKVSKTEGNFTGVLDSDDYFGRSVTCMGDLNGDGNNDLAVGAFWDDDGGFDTGAVWILYMNTNGTVKIHQKISGLVNCFNGALNDSDYFGSSVASIGDLNGDGIGDLAVGATGDGKGSLRRGAVWILFLDFSPFDHDNDGMSDNWEIQYGLNPDINDSSADPDGDGLTNIIEFKAGTYPESVDSDGDGMPDGWEVQHGLNPLVNDAEGDLDGDGFSNIKEYLEGTLPDDPKSRPKRGMPWLQLLLGN